MKTLLALLLLLPFALAAESISEYEKKFDAVMTCGPEGLATKSCKKSLTALYDKPLWTVDQVAAFAKLNQVGWIGLALQSNMMEDEAIKSAQSLFTKSGAHVTLYAYRKHEVVVVKDLEPKAKEEEKKPDEPKKE